MALTTADRDWRASLDRRLRNLEAFLTGSVIRQWTPTLTATSVNPTMGTGAVLDGAYFRSGGVCHFIANILFGSAGVAAGTGTYQIEGLPYTPLARVTSLTQLIEGRARLRDSSTPSTNYQAALILDDAGVLTMRRSSTVAGGTDQLVTDADPWTWAANDRIEIAGAYLLA